MSNGALVHFPSDRVGFTWCGLSLALSTGDAQRGFDHNGLPYSTNMAEVTCPGCDTDKPVYPEQGVVKGRAQTPEQKRAVIERLLAAWEKHPDQRLGQMLVNARNDAPLFYLEDEALADLVERLPVPSPTTIVCSCKMHFDPCGFARGVLTNPECEAHGLLEHRHPMLRQDAS